MKVTKFQNLLVAALFVFAIGSTAFGAGPIVISGGGNPASENCLANDGIVLNGNSGLCSIDGALIGEWVLHLATMGGEREALTALLNGHGCLPNQGKVVVYDIPGEAEPVVVCEFNDGSSIGFETVNLGPYAPENRRLMKILTATFRN